MPRSRFLSANAQVLAALATCPTVDTHCRTAAKAAKATVASGRSSAAVFEDRLVALLLQDRDTIATELLAALPADLHVETVQLVEEPRTRALADIALRYRAKGRKTVTIAVNVKLDRWSRTDNRDLCSLPAFVALATDPAFDPLGVRARTDRTQELLEWVAGRRQIVDGRDYGILSVKAQGATVTAISGYSVLASVKDSDPIVRRHTNREVVQTFPPTGVLDDDYDVNAAVSAALLPKASWSQIRLHLVAAFRDHVEDVPGLAAWLLDLSDGDLEALLAGALGLPPHAVE